MSSERAGILTRAGDRLGSRARFALILAAIVLDRMLEELPVLRAELMMVLRWARDVVRYDVRWIVQEKIRLLWTRWTRGSARRWR